MAFDESQYTGTQGHQTWVEAKKGNLKGVVGAVSAIRDAITIDVLLRQAEGDGIEAVLQRGDVDNVPRGVNGRVYKVIHRPSGTAGAFFAMSSTGAFSQAMRAPTLATFATGEVFAVEVVPHSDWEIVPVEE